MTIWLGFLIIVFLAGILLQRYKPVWKTILLGILILLISAVYYIKWKF